MQGFNPCRVSQQQCLSDMSGTKNSCGQLAHDRTIHHMYQLIYRRRKSVVSAKPNLFVCGFLRQRSRNSVALVSQGVQSSTYMKYVASLNCFVAFRERNPWCNICAAFSLCLYWRVSTKRTGTQSWYSKLSGQYPCLECRSGVGTSWLLQLN